MRQGPLKYETWSLQRMAGTPPPLLRVRGLWNATNLLQGGGGQVLRCLSLLEGRQINLQEISFEFLQRSPLSLTCKTYLNHPLTQTYFVVVVVCFA